MKAAAQAHAEETSGVHARPVCKHCLTPLSQGSLEEFCCVGCSNVFALLSESGLERYYLLRGDRALSPVTGSAPLHVEPWLEALMLEAETQGAVRRVTLDVQGIQCGACVWLIEALFKRQPDALQVGLNPAVGRLSLVFGASFVLSDFVHAVEQFGYRVGPAGKGAAKESQSLLLRTGICVALAMNNMFLTAATYFGLSEGPVYDLLLNASFVIATLSTLIGGSYFIQRAWLAMRRGVLHLDAPIAIGLLLSYVGSVWSLYFAEGRGNYLDTVSVFIAVMLVGRLLQERLVERNRQKLLASDGASGLLSRRIHNGQSELIHCPLIKRGDTLLICPGELLPMRARLLEESAACSLDWISGESEPRKFAHGEELPAGAINVGSSAFRAGALTTFESSELDLLLRVDPQRGQRMAGDFWDKVARIYVLAVLVTSVLCGGLWLWYGASLTSVLDMMTAVLVVTCPCAFGIATPLAYELGVSGLRKLGLYVRDGTFYDRAARVQRIVFDKTGTLTVGALSLCEPASLNQLSAQERVVLYGLTARSNHPKSAAIARELVRLDNKLELTELAVHELPGKGLECVVHGVSYRLGEPTWASPTAQETRGPLFSANGQPLAVLECEELCRADASREVAALASEGYELWIASGDVQARVDAMAQRLGIPAQRTLGALTPDDKRALIERVDHGDTLMIGDGINDGPALSRALCSGTPAVDRPFVPARTDFYFLTPGLQPLRVALRVARKVRRVVKNALVFATAYNVLAVGLCLAGLMRPWLAALLMPTSSLVVLVFTAVSLSARRRVWRS